MIHSQDPQHQFEVRGPLGEPLGVKKSGLHVAFTAGTGVLPLLDLVAHIFYTALGINSQIGVSADDQVGPDFRFKLYVSYRSEKEAVGLKLLEAIHGYFKRTGNPSFELIVRISGKQKTPTWDQAFIEAQLNGTYDKLLKVWVCGTPAMTETFDRALTTMSRQHPDRFKPGVIHML
jgi:NAD(P)H-flavin reductase